MKKLFSLFLLSTFLLSCNDSSNSSFGFGSAVDGEGQVVRKTIDLDDFHSIVLQSSVNVYLKHSDQQKVEVEGQENIIALLNKEVNNGKWYVNFSKSVRNLKTFKVYISLPAIELLKVSGSGNIKGTSAFKGLNNLELTVDGSGDISLEADAIEVECRVAGSGDMDLALNANKIVASIAGSGNIEMEGSSNSFEGRINGSGDLECADLQVKTAKLQLTGSGNCSIAVIDEIQADLTGSGDVYYRGTPNVKANTTGSGEVQSME